MTEITFDPVKRARTLSERGLDFADAGEIFSGAHFNLADDRKDYGEARILTFGVLKGRLVAMVWTERDGARRIISMRHANDREKSRYQAQMG